MAMTPRMMSLHRWLGMVGGVFILIAGATAVGLNHGDQLRSLSEGRDLAEGPYAHSVLATAADPADASRVLAGTNHGLFESVDGGHHWTLATLPVEGDRVGALVTDARRPGRLWASVAGHALLRSDDTGRHWAVTPLPFGEDRHIEALALDVSGEPLVATEAGLYHRSPRGWAFASRPEVPGIERNKRIQSFIAELHMGDVYGRFGVPVTDAIGLSLIALVLSGYFLLIQREYKIRKARRRVRITMAAQAAVPAAHV